jgi:hypothetical protein
MSRSLFHARARALYRRGVYEPVTPTAPHSTKSPRSRTRRVQRHQGPVGLPFRSLVRLADDKGQCLMPAMILTAFGNEPGRTTTARHDVERLCRPVRAGQLVQSFMAAGPVARRLSYWHGTEHWDTEAALRSSRPSIIAASTRRCSAPSRAISSRW